MMSLSLLESMERVGVPYCNKCPYRPEGSGDFGVRQNGRGHMKDVSSKTNYTVTQYIAMTLI